MFSIKVDPKSRRDTVKLVLEFQKASLKKVERALGNAVLNGTRDAKKSVAKINDTGNLNRSIFQSRIERFLFSITARAHYAPYIEFGTGTEVDLSDLNEIGIPESYALQFKGRGIRKVNLPARPFFFLNIKQAFDTAIAILSKTL